MAGNTSYPGALDTTTNLPIASALVSTELDGDGDVNKVHSNLHGVLSEAAVAIEAKIGTGASTPVADRVLRGSGTGVSAWAQVALATDVSGTLPVGNLPTGISDTNVPIFTSGVTDDDFLRVAGTNIEGRSAAEVLSDIGAGAAAGSGSIVTVGALDSGSITSGFTSIDVGAGAITTTGALSIASMGTDWTNAGRTVADMGVVTTIDINGGTINGITDLAVADGGTGASSLTDHGVMLGSGTGAVSVTATGATGQVLTSGGSSADPAWADAGGGGGGTHSFTATGAISNGGLVSINTDGTVSTTVTKALALGTPVQFMQYPIYNPSIAPTYDSNADRVVVFTTVGGYRQGRYSVGEVDPATNSISWGSMTFFNGGSTYDGTNGLCATYDSNSNKVVIGWDTQSSYSYAMVGTIDPATNSMTFGTKVSIAPSLGTTNFVTTNQGVTFDSNSNKVVFVFRDPGTDYGMAVVGTVSGTSISFGTPVVFSTYLYSYSKPVVTFDSNSNKIVIIYGHLYQSTLTQRAIVGTVSGTSISFGSVATMPTGGVSNYSIAFDSNSNKVVLAYRAAGTAYGGAVVGTVSGTTISFGTPVVWKSSATTEIAATYSSGANKIAVAYQNNASGATQFYGYVVVGTVSGTTITFEATHTLLQNSNFYYPSATYDSASDKIVFAHRGPSSYGYSNVFETGGSTLSKWVGISTAAIASGAAGDIGLVGSVNGGQSSLTIGSLYYMQDDSTLSTAVVAGREVGRAVSATQLLITQASIS